MTLFPSKKHLKVLFIASEAAPYAQAGGLGEVMYSLPKALREIGVDARIFIPKYGSIDSQKKYNLKTIYQHLEVPTGDEKAPYLFCNIKFFQPRNEKEAPVYFLENMEYYEKRANIYDYSDDSVRFGLLSRGVLEFLEKNSDWQPDILNCLDWQAGYCVNFLKTKYQGSQKLKNLTVVFSIHNLYHQGTFDHKLVSELDFDDGKSEIPSFFSERFSKINAMKRGVIYSDVVNTVSETYSREILSPEYGEGLNKLLLEVKEKLFGILNGIDYDFWNPKTDKLIYKNYTSSTVHRKEDNKIALQKEFNLPLKKNVPVISMVSRLDEQKGIDLVLEAIHHLLKEVSFQFVLVGGGSERYTKPLLELKEKYPKKIGIFLLPNFTLPHLVFAGADVILCPSRFEPCGVTHLQAMKYGTVPLVRKTGGLADTVENFNPASDSGYGFVFENYNSWCFFKEVVRALENFKHKKVWERLQKRVMELDFSWKESARKYLELYKRAFEIQKARGEK